MKATLKSVAVALSVLAIVIATLLLVDKGAAKDVAANNKTYIKVTVVDLDGSPIHNAQVTVGGATFYTDNKGMSPAIEIDSLTNCYDGEISEWGTVTVIAQKSGYAPAIVFNCVVYAGQTRKLTIKAYPTDNSDLPYVTYVESPPDSYVKEIIK